MGFYYNILRDDITRLLERVQKSGQPYTYTEALWSYILDRKQNRVRSQREYAQLWKVGRGQVRVWRQRMDRDAANRESMGGKYPQHVMKGPTVGDVAKQGVNPDRAQSEPTSNPDIPQNGQESKGSDPPRTQGEPRPSPHTIELEREQEKEEGKNPPPVRPSADERTERWKPRSQRFYEMFAERYPEHLPDDWRENPKGLIEKGAHCLRILSEQRRVPTAEIDRILNFLMFEDDFYLPQGRMKVLHKLNERTRDKSQRHYEVVRSKMERSRNEGSARAAPKAQTYLARFFCPNCEETLGMNVPMGVTPPLPPCENCQHPQMDPIG